MKHTSIMTHTDIVVELCRNEMCNNGQTLWDNLVEEYVVNKIIKDGKYYSELQNLATSFSVKLDKEQVNQIWRGTDACQDFALGFLCAADYDLIMEISYCFINRRGFTDIMSSLC